jgi:RHS repeat-associated protein
VTLRYLYDRANIVAILDEENEVLATILHDEGTDQPLSITVHDRPEDIEAYNALSEDDRYLADLKLQRTYWYHRDHQGSIVALTNKEGEIVESFLYDDAYGKVLDHHKTEETFNPYGYTGREYDAPDLYYYRARYYDPNTARFLSEDPIGFLSGDFNWYRYVGSDPVNFIDPLGFKAQSPICKSIERKIKKLERKAIAPLKKLIAKQTAKLALAPVPLLGWAMAAWTAYDLVQLASDLTSLYKEFDLLDLELKACEKKEKKEAESNQQKGTNIKGRMKKTKVKCFNKNQDKHNGKDFDEQLENQQNGLNDMTADEYLKGREAFDGISCKDGKVGTDGVKNRPKRNASEARKARKKHEESLIRKYEMKKSKTPEADAKAEMKTLAALHNPDMVAAGKDIITGFGDKGINSSIGTQWKDRVGEMDEAACKAKHEGKGQDKMNVELERCNKKGK